MLSLETRRVREGEHWVLSLVPRRLLAGVAMLSEKSNPGLEDVGFSRQNRQINREAPLAMSNRSLTLLLHT
jgi:hypothetical protein